MESVVKGLTQLLDYDPETGLFRRVHKSKSGLRRISKNKKSGLPKGVYRQTANGQLFAMIRRHGKLHYLGTFTTIEEASTAYATAALHLHGRENGDNVSSK